MSTDALFRQFGVTRCEDYDDLIQTAHLLAYAPAPTADGVAVVSHSGGISSLIADHLGHAGIILPPLSENAEAGLNDILSGFGWAANPADITGVASRKEFADVLALLERGTTGGGAAHRHRRDTIPSRDCAGLEGPNFKTPGLPVNGRGQHGGGAGDAERSPRARFHFPKSRRQIPGESFGIPPTPAEVPGRERRISSWVRSQHRPPTVAAGTGPITLTEHAAKIFISHWGIPSTKETQAGCVEEAVEAAEAIGFPVALKLESPHVPHKTEAGVVRLNVQTPNELRQAYGEIIANGLNFAPQAKGAPVLVQEMVEGGVEVISGISQDPQFGPILLFGIGGVFVELYRDVAMRSCPITEADAREMIAEVRGHRLLQGFRGAPEADVDALVGSLLALSQMAVDLDHRRPELDVNPLMVMPKGQGVKAVDAFLNLS